MLKRLWADHRWACLLSLALLVVGVVVSPWVLLAAVVPIGWVVLNKKTAKDDQSLAITEEAEAMSELPKDWEELVNSVYYDEDAMQKLEEIEVELCAAPKGSYSLSDLFVNPDNPLPCLKVLILSFLPVIILCG